MATEMTVPALPLVSGNKIPIIGFGTWQLRGQEAYESTLHALRRGYRHIDTATGYENEKEVGRALRDSGVAREEVFVTTKLPPERAGKERQTLEASLSDLGVDQVDLWLIHWPPGGDASPQTWEQLLVLKGEGKCRDAGVSNYSSAQVDELIAATGEAPAVNQIRWSPAVYDPARAEHLSQNGVVLEGYSPFRASDLGDPILAEVAEAHGVSPAQVVLRWHIDHGFVVIPKSATPARIDSNFDVFGFSLSAQELAMIDGLGKAA